MTDSETRNRPGKRERLVASAVELLHRQGVARTTLAEIADAADVPPGNVYYYFKTRDDLVRAVIDAHADTMRATIASVEEDLPEPGARLKAVIGSWAEMRDLVARYGCPAGTLAAELDKRDDGLDCEAAGLFLLLIDWAETQFRQMGRDDARDLAVTLLAGVQGAALVANSVRDPEIMSSQVRRLEEWIDSLA